MAIKIIGEKYCPFQNDNMYEFICDTEADVANLPKSCTGSRALVVSTGDVYIVNASGNWTVFGG